MALTLQLHLIKRAFVFIRVFFFGFICLRPGFIGADGRVLHVVMASSVSFQLENAAKAKTKPNQTKQTNKAEKKQERTEK